ncbi:hypothetical protein [Microbulbifer yueqingensis]|uniref:hypothetical protein n=1 Tax=Microbulbifer yueqingensis TaxID=658219 RepID=UPI00111373BC|nr:hypothetical protein [Microbulbifer yueqingensis]
MEKILCGEISKGSVQVIVRDSAYFIRYDAGAHQVVWREDVISYVEAMEIVKDQSCVERVLMNLQRRLLDSGVKPYVSNWNPDASNT